MRLIDEARFLKERVVDEKADRERNGSTLQCSDSVV